VTPSAAVTLNKTNAARLLDDLGLSYELVGFTVNESDLTAETAAKLLGLPEKMVYKTILLKGDRSGYLEACLPAGQELDLKSLAYASGNRSVTLVPVGQLFNLTGYRRGGCSPLAGKKKYQVYIDNKVLELDRMAINAGAKGVMLLLAPKDLILAAGAIPAAITRPAKNPYCQPQS
jgi:Cys-tRNA(Pro)/Cys-tRNA(Cys) deacylase